MNPSRFINNRYIFLCLRVEYYLPIQYSQFRYQYHIHRFQLILLCGKHFQKESGRKTEERQVIDSIGGIFLQIEIAFSKETQMWSRFVLKYY